MALTDFDPWFGYMQSDLPSHGTGAPPYMGLPSGGSTGTGFPSSGSSKFDWGTAIGTAAPLAASLFAGNSGSITGDVRGIQKSAEDQLRQGSEMVVQGQQNIAPVLKYFKALMSENPSEVLAATAPERSRIVDQYDAAKRAAGQFTPRGGGQSSTQMEAGAREASDLGKVTADARRNAATSLGEFGNRQIEQGLTAEERAQQQLSQVLGPLFNQQ